MQYRYAKLKSTGRIVATQSGGNPDTDDLDVFAAGVGWSVDQLEVGYESAEVVSQWTQAQDEAERTYVDKRQQSYPSITDQLDMLWHAMDTGEIPKSTIFYDINKSIKDKFPKE
jgi:hypothetical protein